MTPDRERELSKQVRDLAKQVDELQNVVILIGWIGGAFLVALILRVFLGIF